MHSTFREFHDKFNYFDIQESIEFYSVFQSYPFFNFLKLDTTLLSCIQSQILERYTELKPYFLYDEDTLLQRDLEALLARLAIGDRKNFTAYKKINVSQPRSRLLFKTLFEKGIIRKEHSREKPLREFKGQLIKKSLRRYEIQDKIHFVDNFTRFWFTFLSHLDEESLHVNISKALETISQSMEQYISLTFEELSNELMIKKIGPDNIENFGSYWDKNIEIDLMIETKDGKIVVGESKWKNHKVCKNILNTLEKKCMRANIEVDEFVLFSKSGFSKELKNLNRTDISLYDINEFKELYDR
jgi:hypothetical protein